MARTFTLTGIHRCFASQSAGCFGCGGGYSCVGTSAEGAGLQKVAVRKGAVGDGVGEGGKKG